MYASTAAPPILLSYEGKGVMYIMHSRRVQDSSRDFTSSSGIVSLGGRTVDPSSACAGSPRLTKAD